MSPPQAVVMGELGDIFWDLAPVVTYSPGYDLGCTMYVANPTEAEKEYSLMGRLTRNDTVLSEEAVPVYGYAWFNVAAGDFVRLRGALRFDETDCDLALLLIERETEQATDSVSTRLVSPAAGAVGGAPAPGWPGAPTAPGGGFDWSQMLMTFMPVIMLGMVIPVLRPEKQKKEAVTTPAREERKLLPPGRRE